MKKKYLMLMVVIAVSLVFALTGCKKKAPVVEPTPTPVEKPVEKANEDEKEKIVKEFDAIAANPKDLNDIITFVDKNIGKLEELDADYMVDTLEKSLEKNLENIQDKIFANDKDNELMKIAGKEFYFPKDKIEEIKNKKLKEEVINLYNNRMKLVNVEGAFYPIINYKGFEAYNEFISEEWRDYFALRALDSEDVPFVDDGIRIPFDQLADRIIKAENFLNKFLDSKREEVVLEIYEDKLSAYMKGLGNTPIYDNVKTKIIFDDVMDSYDRVSKIDGYITPSIIYKYIEEIKANKGIIDERIFKEANKLIAEAVEMLKEFK